MHSDVQTVHRRVMTAQSCALVTSYMQAPTHRHGRAVDRRQQVQHELYSKTYSVKPPSHRHGRAVDGQQQVRHHHLHKLLVGHLLHNDTNLLDCLYIIYILYKCQYEE